MGSFQDSTSHVDEDDTMFYQELTRRILMLTDEDDDAVERQRRPVVHGGFRSRPVARSYYSWSETGRSSVPGWMESLWAGGGGGTGVFIPSGAATGRKKSGRRRYNGKATKSNDRGRVVYSAGTKLHG